MAIPRWLKSEYAASAREEIPCNLCGAKVARVLGERDCYGLSVRSVICSRCGLIYLSPRPKAGWYRRFYESGIYRQLLSGHGPPRTFSPEELFARGRWFGTKLLTRLKPHCRPGLTVEVGSSAGGILSVFRDELGVSVLGIEPSEAESAYARAKGVPSEVALIEEFSKPIPPAANIVSVQSLNHFLDPKSFLVWAWRSLEPGGRLILVVENFRSAAEKVHSLTRAVQVDHPYMFVPETLRLFVEAAGFDLVFFEDWGTGAGQVVSGITTICLCLVAEKSSRVPFRNVSIPPGLGERVLASLREIGWSRALARHIRRYLHPHMFQKPMVWILFGAVALRLWGIDYGLPLFLVNDEPAHILGALKMIELKTLLPVFHGEEFQSVLSYPPVPSYLLLPVLVPTLGIHYLFSGAPPLEAYRAMLALDPSVIWIAARLVNVLLGLAVIAAVYLVARNFLRNERAALLAAVFLALSPYHIYLSQTVRHWMPSTLAICLLWLLALRIGRGTAWTPLYAATGLVGGISAGGINTASAVAMLFPLAAHLAARTKRSLVQKLTDRRLLILVAAFALGAIMFILVYPYGFTRAEGAPGPLADIARRFTNLGRASLGDWLEFLFAYAGILFRYEVMPFLAGIAGALFLLRDSSRRFWVILVTAYALAYLTALYLFFNMIPRGIIFLLPFLAVFAGYAAERILLWSQNIVRPTLAGMFLVFGFWSLVFFAWPLVTDLRYAWVLSRPDTRLEAREWIAGNLPAGSAILLDSQYLRLPSTQESVRELAGIDGRALRAADRAVLVLPEGERPQPAYRVLNLHFLSPERPERTIADPEPFRRRGFRYLAVEHVRRDQGDLRPEARALTERSRRIAFFDPWSDASHQESLTASGEIASSPLASLFALERFGRFISIYELGSDIRR